LEISTLIGLIGAFAFIIISIMMGGDIGGFIDPGSIMIVVGGVVCATMVAYPMDVLKTIPKLIGLTFKAQKMDINKDLDMIINIANVARREGILALEETIKDSDDPFLKKGIMLIIDGSDPELVRSIMETELSFLSDRHASGAAVLETMSALSPAFGMIGTLIGLINMLAVLDDPSALGGGMATALVTTFYGSFLANVLFTPMARKLRTMSRNEYLRKELLLEGILSIQDGENPRIIREKLNAFLARNQIKPEDDGKAGSGNAEE
jgi:chemotaxis protein MotA